MRVLQLIDSLEAGGAERIAVTFANALTEHLEQSYLCTTRKEGTLKSSLQKDVAYIFLNKKKTLDINAVFRLKKFLKSEKISIVHAHSTSYFFATLVKIVYPKITLIWHEHHGNRVQKKRKNYKALWLCSFFFTSIITVSQSLKNWSIKNLHTKNVIYLPNFVDISNFSESHCEHKVMICVSNLRKPKNHLNLLTAFHIVHHLYPDWKLKIIGRDFEDGYALEMKKYINEQKLEDSVRLLGLRNDIAFQLQEASIGVLSSDSEGLPMALLEYGASGLAVVCTNVGHCKSVIDSAGMIVPPKDSDALAAALIKYIESSSLRKRDGANFRKRVKDYFSLEHCLGKLLRIYQNDTN